MESAGEAFQSLLGNNRDLSLREQVSRATCAKFLPRLFPFSQRLNISMKGCCAWEWREELRPVPWSHFGVLSLAFQPRLSRSYRNMQALTGQIGPHM
eukprot:53789-Rhodomonas_salina.1